MSERVGVICVLCGTRPGGSARYAEDARELGERLGAASLRVLCGGGGVGLMGALADGALARGGQVEGVIPKALLDLDITHPGLTALQVVEGLAEQHAAMVERADAFVALPGGLGTLYELTMAIAGAQLGVHSRPIVVANLDGYFDHMLAALRYAVQEEFAAWEDLRLVHSFKTLPALVDALIELRERRAGSRLLNAVADNQRRHEELDALARDLARGATPGTGHAGAVRRRGMTTLSDPPAR